MERRTVQLLTAAATASALILGGVGGATGPVAAAVGEPTVRFAAAGDFDANSNTRAVLDTVVATGSDLALALGDLSYAETGAEQGWCDLVTQSVGAGFPFELIAGNTRPTVRTGTSTTSPRACPTRCPG